LVDQSVATPEQIKVGLPIVRGAKTRGVGAGELPMHEAVHSFQSDQVRESKV
jgi:hypothetical protein